jgi:PKD repeat protein
MLLQFISEDMTSPTANAGVDQTIQEGELVALNASASQDNRWIQNYTWTFTDQVTPITLTGMTPSYTFSSPGSYTVTLNVTDTSALSDTDTLTITVQEIEEPFDFPWLYIGSAAVICSIVGYVLLKRRQ